MAIKPNGEAPHVFAGIKKEGIQPVVSHEDIGGRRGENNAKKKFFLSAFNSGLKEFAISPLLVVQFAWIPLGQPGRHYQLSRINVRIYLVCSCMVVVAPINHPSI